MSAHTDPATSAHLGHGLVVAWCIDADGNPWPWVLTRGHHPDHGCNCTACAPTNNPDRCPPSGSTASPPSPAPAAADPAPTDTPAGHPWPSLAPPAAGTPPNAPPRRQPARSHERPSTGGPPCRPRSTPSLRRRRCEVVTTR